MSNQYHHFYNELYLLLFIIIFMVIDNTNIAYASSSSVSNRIKGCNVVQRATLAKTWGGGNSHCLLLGGRLCNRDEYCPNGRGKFNFLLYIHTHTHTHTLSLSLSLPLPNKFICRLGRSCMNC